MSDDNSLPPIGPDEESCEPENQFALDDFIADLREQAKRDALSVLSPENLAMLVHIQKADSAAFERLRKDVQKLGLPYSRFDLAVKQQAKIMGQIQGRAQSRVSDQLFAIANEAEYFSDATGIAYADIVIEDGHRETWAVVKNSGFELWLRHRYYQKTKTAPNADALNGVLHTLIAKAHAEGVKREVHMRVASHEERIYIDLCNDQWQAIEVSADGYQIIKEYPVRFRRKKGMRPLPMPQPGGSINDLRPFMNVATDSGFILIVGWLLMALRGYGPYPILVLTGEHGTAKTTLLSSLRKLVDPHTSPLRSLPRNEHELFIAAANSLVLAFDNLSFLSDSMSDAFCRISTGGGYSVRTLYADDEETLFEVSRPIVINGIESVGTRGDIVDRAIILLLEPIPEEMRRPIKEIERDFEAALPGIFDALLKVMVTGLKRLPDTASNGSPRMADFARWITACEAGAGWPEGAFMKAYLENRAAANDDVIASSPLATAICDFIDQIGGSWSGTATILLENLASLPSDIIRRDKRLWPSTPRVLSERLKRVSSAMRKVGIEIVYGDRGAKRERLIHTTRANPNATIPTTGATPATIGSAADDEKPTETKRMKRQKKFT